MAHEKKENAGMREHEGAEKERKRKSKPAKRGRGDARLGVRRRVNLEESAGW